MQQSPLMSGLLGRMLVALPLVWSVSGCDAVNQITKRPEAKHSAESKPDVRAASQLEDGFGVEDLENSLQDQHESMISSSSNDKAYVISIHEKNLDKEFLMQTSMSYQAMFQGSSGLKSRVVAFHRKGDALFLLEATQGHVVSDDMESTLILAELPIKKQVGSRIYFDFNEGMSQLFMAADWAGKDFEGPFYSGNSWEGAKLGVRYLKHAERDVRKNSLSVTQVAQLDVNFLGSQISPSVAVTYYFSPYRPKKAFTPKVSPEFDHMGFFEVSPQLIDGQDVVYASKFDATQKIVYAVSANTPSDYKQAIKDGILYWNKAFGRDVVEVIDAPQGISAPHQSYNIVQWVNWDNAGFAYADGQMDPRTGEILHAQVFLTSAFAFSSKMQAYAILRRIKEREKQLMAKVNGVGLKGFSSSLLCQMDKTKSLVMRLESLLARSDISDAEILRLSQDYVAEVTAHEIGHTLGLRHNFAGTLAANYDSPESRKEVFHQYVETGHMSPEVVPSSSVMDYHLFEESTMIGSTMRDEAHQSALTYDRLAVKSLYDLEANAQDAAVADQKPLFCTDSHVGTFLDCNLFDAGQDVFTYAAADATSQWDRLAHMIAETFIMAKVMDPESEPDMLSFAPFLPLEYLTFRIASNKGLLLRALDPQTRLLRVERRYPVVNGLNEQDMVLETRAMIADRIAQMGGISAAMGLYPQDAGAVIAEHFDRLITSQLYRQGTIGAGLTYEFTDADIVAMKRIVRKYLAPLDQVLVRQELEVLQRMEKIIDNELGDTFAAYLGEFMQKVLFSETGRTPFEVTIPSDAGESASTTSMTFELPKYRYPYQVRRSAAALLCGRSDNLIWGNTEKEALIQELKHRALRPSDLDEATWVSLQLPVSIRREIAEHSRITNTVNYCY